MGSTCTTTAAGCSWAARSTRKAPRRKVGKHQTAVHRRSREAPHRRVRQLSTHLRSHVRRRASGMGPSRQRHDSQKLGITAAQANMLKCAKGHVLDVAAGTLESYKLYGSISSLTAVDKSVVMCLEMKRKIEAAKPDFPVTIVCADACDLPFDNESFNTVVTSHALCSVEQPDSCLKEIARVMKPTARYFAIERGQVYYTYLRRALNWLKVYPNPAVPWKYGHFEDRDPLALVRSCTALALADFEVFGYGMNYSIVARRPHTDKVSELASDPTPRPGAKIIYQYTPELA
ncbi:methyltransferase, putative [Babesia caballi]|uniref:Methyltransferase, putative n=1 Tax=Babesia caballi TaxID=5871 RepID=A0AAV4LY94_BABCB|nr:methyltransferase, putative [Babesia caballi]